MSNHVVLGAGPVGRAIVQSLVSRQIDVTVVSRSGTGVPGARSIAASVLDTDRLKEIVAGADAVYQASQPEYHRWPEEFPAMQDSIVRAVRDSGAVLVAVENLYGYGPVKGPMSESLPLVATGRKGKVRSDMWRALETESKAGRLKVTAGRASDFFGPYAEGSAVGDRFFLPLIAGKKAEVMGNPDALHSYTYVKDFGEALVRLALDERSLGRAWHVPNAPAVSNRKFLETAAAIAGGVTSIMDMPNTAPSVLSVDVLEQKYEIASNSSLANYSFFMGLSKDNIEEALKVSTEDVCGLTDDGLYFDETHPTLCNSLEYLEKIFSASASPW